MQTVDHVGGANTECDFMKIGKSPTSNMIFNLDVFRFHFCWNTIAIVETKVVFISNPCIIPKYVQVIEWGEIFVHDHRFQKYLKREGKPDMAETSLKSPVSWVWSWQVWLAVVKVHWLLATRILHSMMWIHQLILCSVVLWHPCRLSEETIVFCSFNYYWSHG